MRVGRFRDTPTPTWPRSDYELELILLLRAAGPADVARVAVASPLWRRASIVGCQLPKLNVEGSSPFARSIRMRERGMQGVCQRATLRPNGEMAENGPSTSLSNGEVTLRGPRHLLELTSLSARRRSRKRPSRPCGCRGRSPSIDPNHKLARVTFAE